MLPLHRQVHRLFFIFFSQKFQDVTHLPYSEPRFLPHTSGLVLLMSYIQLLKYIIFKYPTFCTFPVSDSKLWVLKVIICVQHCCCLQEPMGYKSQLCKFCNALYTSKKWILSALIWERVKKWAAAWTGGCFISSESDDAETASYLYNKMSDNEIQTKTLTEIMLCLPVWT
jgi:hypothetical protein